jgi:hypothetical protein
MVEVTRFSEKSVLTEAKQRHISEGGILLYLNTYVVAVHATNPRGLWFDYRRHYIFRVTEDLEQGPLSLVRINEELLERKVAASV